MIKGTLEKRFNQNRNGVWWLQINGSVEREAFPLMSAIEDNTLLQKFVAVQEQQLVIDLSTLEEFDSRGLQVLLMLHKQFTPQNIQVTLRNPNPYLSRIFRITQFDRFFPVEYDDDYNSDD
jgi:anti-anti-sigma factor